MSAPECRFPEKRRDSLAERILNDIFREKEGQQRADNKLDGKAESVVFISACLRSILDLLGLSWPRDYYFSAQQRPSFRNQRILNFGAVLDIMLRSRLSKNTLPYFFLSHKLNLFIVINIDTVQKQKAQVLLAW